MLRARTNASEIPIVVLVSSLHLMKEYRTRDKKTRYHREILFHSINELVR